MITNDGWSDVQPDQSHDLRIQFGGWTPWDLRSRGLQFTPDGPVYLYAEAADENMLSEFQRAVTFRVTIDGKRRDILQLSGSSRAWREVESCQESNANP